MLFFLDGGLRRTLKTVMGIVLSELYLTWPPQFSVTHIKLRNSNGFWEFFQNFELIITKITLLPFNLTALFV